MQARGGEARSENRTPHDDFIVLPERVFPAFAGEREQRNGPAFSQCGHLRRLCRKSDRSIEKTVSGECMKNHSFIGLVAFFTAAVAFADPRPLTLKEVTEKVSKENYFVLQNAQRVY